MIENLTYWKTVEDLSISQAAMLFAEEDPLKEINDPKWEYLTDDKCSKDSIKFRNDLLYSIKTSNLEIKAEGIYQEDINGQYVTFTDPDTTITTRTELAIWAHFNGYSPSFLEDDLDNIEDILEKERLGIEARTQNLKERFDNFVKILPGVIKEIQSIRKYAKGLNKSLSIEKKAAIAQKYYDLNKISFKHIWSADLINKEWFEASHGARTAIHEILPTLARKRGIHITKENAEKLYKAIKRKEKVPEIPYSDMIPDKY